MTDNAATPSAMLDHPGAAANGDRTSEGSARGLPGRDAIGGARGLDRPGAP
jgi:hypothetical protein